MATTIYEYCAIVFLPALTFSTYVALNLALNYYYHLGVSALFMPIILFVFIGITFYIITPTQPLTALGIIQLTANTVGELFYNFADLHTPIFVVLVPSGVFIFWTHVMYILLSARGMEEEMGHLGKMAKWMHNCLAIRVTEGGDVGLPLSTDSHRNLSKQSLV